MRIPLLISKLPIQLIYTLYESLHATNRGNHFDFGIKLHQTKPAKLPNFQETQHPKSIQLDIHLLHRESDLFKTN